MIISRKVLLFSEYMMLFDQIIENSLEEEEDENDNKIEDKAVIEMEKIVYSLNETVTKFWFLSNIFSIPVQIYDQSQFSDIHIIKSIFSHLDAVTKMKRIVKNTTEWS